MIEKAFKHVSDLPNKHRLFHWDRITARSTIDICSAFLSELCSSVFWSELCLRGIVRCWQMHIQLFYVRNQRNILVKFRCSNEKSYRRYSCFVWWRYKCCRYMYDSMWGECRACMCGTRIRNFPLYSTKRFGDRSSGNSS